MTKTRAPFQHHQRPSSCLEISRYDSLPTSGDDRTESGILH
jgi:hypothetical protein